MRRGSWAFIVTVCLTGCGASPVGPAPCDRPEDQEPHPYRQGLCRGDTYMTATWTGGDLLHFPGGAFVQIFHGLGVVPSEWNAYLSFERCGGDGAIAEAAGNQVQLEAMDEQSITLLNGTCVDDFFLLVTARAGGGTCGFPETGPMCEPVHTDGDD